MSSIQQLINSALGTGISDIMNQNKMLIDNQQRQINQ